MGDGDEGIKGSIEVDLGLDLVKVQTKDQCAKVKDSSVALHYNVRQGTRYLYALTIHPLPFPGNSFK